MMCILSTLIIISYHINMAGVTTRAPRCRVVKGHA